MFGEAYDNILDNLLILHTLGILYLQLCQVFDDPLLRFRLERFHQVNVLWHAPSWDEIFCTADIRFQPLQIKRWWLCVFIQVLFHELFSLRIHDDELFENFVGFWQVDVNWVLSKCSSIHYASAKQEALICHEILDTTFGVIGRQ